MNLFKIYAIFFALITVFNAQTQSTRKPEYPINSIFINRWSQRAMSGKIITQEELMPLFEAARWAASSYNNQPWHFVYALKGSPTWDLLFDTLVPFNQSWAKNAGAFVLVCSSKIFTQSRAHSFDTGAAWAHFALQGCENNLVVHPMEGFDPEKARAICKVPESYNVEIIVAVGHPGKKSKLPLDLQEREVPSDRKNIETFVFKDSFQT